MVSIYCNKISKIEIDSDNDDDYIDYDTGWPTDDRGGGRSWFPDNPGWVSRREDKDKEDNVSDHDHDHDLSVANHDQV